MEMEGMLMMISRRRSLENLNIESISDYPITTSTTNCPTWKLYENPFYTNTPHKQHQENKSCDHQLKQIHRLQIPISARKIAASFWDLTFIRPFMESELDMARAKITELKAELEQERKARKKAESMTKRIGREVSELKKGREALEQLCQELAKQVSSDKAEMNRMHKDMEEERKMLRMAEVLREERVQMKLGEAKFLLEEKLSELEATKTKQMPQYIDQSKAEAQRGHIGNVNKTWSNSNGGVNNISHDSSSLLPNQRRASPEAENPHIKRGIKGFVEFPKVVRAIGSKGRHLGTKMECQKAQLRILLKQKTPIRSNTLITS